MRNKVRRLWWFWPIYLLAATGALSWRQEPYNPMDTVPPPVQLGSAAERWLANG